MKSAHRQAHSRANGRWAIYWYAWRTSFHLHFFKAARTALTPDLFAQVEADAEARLLRALETITAEIEPNCSAQDQAKGSHNAAD